MISYLIFLFLKLLFQLGCLNFSPENGYKVQNPNRPWASKKLDILLTSTCFHDPAKAARLSLKKVQN